MGAPAWHVSRENHDQRPVAASIQIGEINLDIKKLQEAFVAKKKTLVVAESCTGGRIATEITKVPGASAYFLGSLVVYSDQMKRDLLHVPEDLIKKNGAVSREAVEAMLAGLFKISPADFGIAVSGIAGPTGGLPDKPVGTVWAAIGMRDKAPSIFTFRAPGDRAQVILHTTERLLETLHQML